MYANFALQNFRCFSSTGNVRIAPVTILVGENSSGKTSFLAALRQILEAFQGAKGSSFNREPYFLGSFEQIAHYRGGRSGRAKSFSLSIEISSEETQEELFSSSRKSLREARHELTFGKGTTQPELTEYAVSSRTAFARFDFSGTKPRIIFGRSGEKGIQIDPDRVPPSLLMRRDVSYLGFFLQDVLLRTRADLFDLGEQHSDVVRSLVNTIRSTSRYLEKSIFASAPVRIQPRRVYTPSELTSLNAGEQVPLEMANEKLMTPDKWAITKSKLADFGSRSGLFEEVEIKC